MVRRWVKWSPAAVLVALACSGRSTRTTSTDENAGEGAGGSQPNAGSPNGLGGSGLGNGGAGGTTGGAGAGFGGSALGGDAGSAAGGSPRGGVGGAGVGGAGVGGAGVGGAGAGVGGAGNFSIGCFERGSAIATPSGSVAIEALAVGDEVLAFDERSGRVVPRRVTQTFVHTVPQTGRLRLADGRELRVTAEHPIYLVDHQRYARADEVDERSTLLSLTPAKAGAGAVALGVEVTGQDFVAIDRTTVVYNISVADLENYFVEGVLVHNKSGAGPGGTCSAPPWSSGECNTHPMCLDYEDSPVEMVSADQPASDGTGFEHIDITTCSPPADDEEYRLVAVDVWLATPESSIPGFAVYGETAACSGMHNLSIRMPYSAATAGWTTQCFKVWAPATGSRFAIVSLDDATLVKNPRFVASCECTRQGWAPVACVSSMYKSACEQD